MKKGKNLRCAICTRKSTMEGLEQDFNSLDAQRASCEAYIQSQTHEGWRTCCPSCMLMAASLVDQWIDRHLKP